MASTPSLGGGGGGGGLATDGEGATAEPCGAAAGCPYARAPERKRVTPNTVDEAFFTRRAPVMAPRRPVGPSRRVYSSCVGSRSRVAERLSRSVRLNGMGSYPVHAASERLFFSAHPPRARLAPPRSRRRAR